MSDTKVTVVLWKEGHTSGLQKSGSRCGTPEGAEKQALWEIDANVIDCHTHAKGGSKLSAPNDYFL